MFDSDLSCRFSPVSQFYKPCRKFSLLKTALYLLPGFIWPKVEPPDLLVVIKYLVKRARFWWKMVVGSSFFLT